MAGIRSEDFREALALFWREKGVALCAQAQGDGVPCSELGRECETCAEAVKALHEARQAELRAQRP